MLAGRGQLGIAFAHVYAAEMGQLGIAFAHVYAAEMGISRLKKASVLTQFQVLAPYMGVLNILPY